MTGLDKIILAIDGEAERTALSVRLAAEKKAAQITAEGESRAQEAYEKYLADCRRECLRELENAKSSAESNSRSELLACKSELIDRAERAAAEKIAAMTDSEYFALILRLADRCSRPTDGIVSFNAADLKRIPADFESRLNGGAAGGRLKISSEPADIDGGFIISFGDITENCSISAVMEAERELARDAAAAVLFARGDGE